MFRYNNLLFISLLIIFGTSSMRCTKGESVAALPESNSSTNLKNVRTLSVTIDEAQDEIQATGTTTPLASTKIAASVSGLIVSFPIKEGDVVKKGQVLATLDQRGYRLTLRQAEANIEAAKVAVDAATREKNRFQRLMQEDATAKAQFDQVMDKFRGAEAAMKQAMVARDMAKKALSDTLIKAPYNGIVVKKLASVGDFATSMPPTVLLTMMDIHALELKISLPEPELPRIAPQAEIEANFTSINRTIRTRISRIVRNVDPMTRSFEVIAEIPNADLSLKPGLFGKVTISASGPRKRLLLPMQAVVDEGSGIFSLYLVQGRNARRVEVKIAAAGQDKVEILSGLNGLEEVILDSSGLLDGDPIFPHPMGAIKSDQNIKAEAHQ